MKRVLPLLVLAVLLPGCGIGSDDAAPSDESDIRAAMMTCFEEGGLEPALEGDDGSEEIVVGDGSDAPRVRFFLTAGESEAAHFQGKGEGAEQIGAAWLYVNEGSEDDLQVMEDCLAEQ